jgi:hypothetical protein
LNGPFELRLSIQTEKKAPAIYLDVYAASKTKNHFVAQEFSTEMLRINDEKEKKKKKSLFKKSFVCLVFFCLRRNNNNTRFGRAAISRRRRGVPKWFYDSFSPIPANIVDTILYRARPPYIWAPLKKKKKRKKNI